MSLSEQDIESIRQLVTLKLGPILEDMSLHYSDYRQLVPSHLGAIVMDELKKLIDLHMSEVGFQVDEKRQELLEPVS